MTCPFCLADLVSLPRQGRGNDATSRWYGCSCCGCTWRGCVDKVTQVHRLAWIPACLHPVPAWATTWATT